ncbi:hypothetical protein F5J12DRAFT_423628 [Pisolithus orientalis]|uniref:uncharacterized protein n=1 Tax=Pisolithus orientalis TaxID=936130 RepID=UPI0022243BF1|nr:uncharacterized protein F5J12DRAFT_423628 [Pisolithus orientalis]KAI5993829.1 hypothetical protein F5J12DRAFT_423628 [Pisolithus orientalis]
MSSQQSTSTPAWTEDLLRRSLLAEEIIDVHFHLFSSRSKSSKRVRHPRVLNSNTALLKNSAKYFADSECYAISNNVFRGTNHLDLVFSSETTPSGPKTVDVKDSDELFDGLPLGDYGYESDSDLEDEDDGNTDEDDDGYEMNYDVKKSPGTISGPDERNDEKLDTKIAQANCARPSVSYKGRRIFVKDTAFQTWYCLVYYLYTGVITFSPLMSSGSRDSQSLTPNGDKRPLCSAKSMYALATKLGLNQPRDQAFAFICKNVNENNVLQELACSFAGRYPDVLESELDLLAQNLATIPVIQGFPQLMRRIAKNELANGADILIGLHTRIIRQHYLSVPNTTSSSTRPAPALSLTPPTTTVPQVQPATTVPLTQLAPTTPSLFHTPPTVASATQPFSFPTAFLTTKAGGGVFANASKTK